MRASIFLIAIVAIAMAADVAPAQAGFLSRLFHGRSRGYASCGR